MLKFRLLRDRGLLVLRPIEALSREDFERLSKEVDPYLEAKGELAGILIDAPAFPGWKNFPSFLAHLRFVRTHHRRIRRVAVVTDSSFLSVAPKVAKAFVSADLQTFAISERKAALRWVLGVEPAARKPRSRAKPRRR